MYSHCDLTESMSHPSNSFIDDISDPTLFVASYCVAENAKALRKHQFRFFSSLFTQIPTNSVLLVIETTHRLYPEIIKAAFEGIEDSSDLDIIFPRISHSFRHGYALCIQKVVKSDKDKEIHGSYDTDIAANDDNDALAAFDKMEVSPRWESPRLETKRARVNSSEIPTPIFKESIIIGRFIRV